MAVFLSFFLMTLKENQLEKFCLSSIWDLETVCSHTDTRGKVFSLSESDCLTQRIQMQLSENRKIFSEFFSAFLKSAQNFEYFEKKMSSEVICFWSFRLKKAGLLKLLKSPVSEHLWTVNMLKGPKHFLNLHGSILVRFFDHSEKNQLEYFCLSIIFNLETVC